LAKTQDYNLGEFTFPRGWFVVADGAEVSAKPLNVRYFGQDLVIFRGGSGTVVMLDAYCPHMGTHFGKSTTSWTVASGRHVEGDSIRCPFHGWRFGADGKCNEIPYFDGAIPEQARVRSWTVAERYGIVFAWHDAEGLAPDIDLPPYPEWDDPQWLRWDGLRLVGDMNTHPIEVVDNTSDVAHLDHLHGSEVVWYENEVAGPFYWQRQSSRGRTTDEANPMAGAPFSTDVYYSGPGLLCSRFEEAHLAQLIAHTPIDDGSVRLWQATMMRSPKPVVDEAVRGALKHINDTMVHGLTEDYEVWANKRPAVQILRIPTDGPFLQARTWYSQFYNRRDKAAGILARVQGVHRVRGMPAAPRVAAE
jgi:3-ketosteroid 9alpha-monooxygenase subunit A